MMLVPGTNVKTKEILTQTQVLHLDRDAESLFGWKFNKKGQANNA